jgi:hypothetical protein
VNTCEGERVTAAAGQKQPSLDRGSAAAFALSSSAGSWSRLIGETPALMPDNDGMTNATSNELTLPPVDDILTPKEMEFLTPKELEIERKAKLEELKKRSWMTQSAAQIAGRVPVSVFAMGVLVAAG